MCPDGGFQRFRVTLTDFARGREAQLWVIKRGGELCRLEADDDEHGNEHSHEQAEQEEDARLTFTTDVLLIRAP
ncbi:hypothetical protein Poli38472_013885 [Pythium oligandrum]|uniref:Uncharacterized protein n=1 Tax=Pythium oligandrum TaxID=41045 RepID=A0A8K1FDR0_PYTOL|nr:hypothetical protein Poli38472_013885 [Pythium oligandrum]|eukprot:TMW55123.1 hypothetical protein Poli38472_013885 [Pythium oligandrum]